MSYSLFLPTLPTLSPFYGRASYWKANPEPRGIAAPCKAIQDGLGFWIPRHGFWILRQLNRDSGFLELYSWFKKHWAELFKAGLRLPRVSARFEFRFESLKKISAGILFVYKLMIGSSKSKNNRENYPRKCSEHKKKKLGLNTNRPFNNWALESRSHKQNIPDSGFQRQNFPDSGIQILLHGVE